MLILRKTLTYSGFVMATILVVFAFVTATSYMQLIIAAILYPAIVYFAFKIFPRGSRWEPVKISEKKLQFESHQPKTETIKTETAFVADIDKRAFLKIIGATGISFFLFSLLGRRADNFFSGNTGQFSGSGQSAQTETSPTDGYKISEIDEGLVTYYGFINKDGAWLVMREDSDTSNFRYAKGGSDFPGNWGNRENLRYDYFYNLF